MNVDGSGYGSSWKSMEAEVSRWKSMEASGSRYGCSGEAEVDLEADGKASNNFLELNILPFSSMEINLPSKVRLWK